MIITHHDFGHRASSLPITCSINLYRRHNVRVVAIEDPYRSPCCIHHLKIFDRERQAKIQTYRDDLSLSERYQVVHDFLRCCIVSSHGQLASALLAPNQQHLDRGVSLE